MSIYLHLTLSQGVAGLSKRDIQLFVDAGYNTVESVAYTYAVRRRQLALDIITN